MNPIQTTAVSMGIDLDHLPAHVAIIMDGNGRWATSRGLARIKGHAEGYASLKRAVIAANDLGIKFLTVYAFSVENWRRPQDEVLGLMKLIEHATRTELEEMHRKNAIVNISGRWHELPDSLQDIFRQSIEKTKNNSGITFTLAVNYGGRAEIVDAVKGLVASGVPSDEIDEEAISARLYNPHHPEPDLMIRTAGEMRWSNFLIWQSAYCELVVTPVAWPEFSEQDLLDSVLAFQQRTRKFGAVV